MWVPGVRAVDKKETKKNETLLKRYMAVPYINTWIARPQRR